MPRGIPKARSDETAMRYTSFHVPLGLNPKHQHSSYLRNEFNNHFARASRRPDRAMPESPAHRTHNTIVIHPGTSTLRIGRASDLEPMSIPSVVLRKLRRPPTPETSDSEARKDGTGANNGPKPKGGVVASPFVQGISRPRAPPANSGPAAANPENAEEAPAGEDEYAVHLTSDDPFEEKLASILVSLRDRMRFYKFRVTPNARRLATTFNSSSGPETVPEPEDRELLRHRDRLRSREVVVGNEALLLESAPNLEDTYMIRSPVRGRVFNTKDYPPGATQLLLADIEALLTHAIVERLEIDRRAMRECSVVLVVPDVWDRAWVKDWVGLLLRDLGFARVCVQQESLAATYGAGITSACVVDIGASVTSIACVDDGLVLADTRMQLLLGGNDVTEFLHVLLQRIAFPYAEANLGRMHDWIMLDELKKNMCSLNEADVALNLYTFAQRAPGAPTKKYSFRAYDEAILAPMCVFEPRVVEFETKRRSSGGIGAKGGVEEDIQENPADRLSQAMIISTQHLLAMLPIEPPVAQEAYFGEQSATEDPVMEDDGAPAEASSPAKVNVTESVPDTPGTELPTPLPSAPSGLNYVPPVAIDVSFEAAKLPLDVAIFNSARAAGGDDKIRKYLQALLVVGGGASLPGMAHALESRLQAIATPLVPAMERVTVVPPPRGVDPAILVWRGGATLAKMEGISDLWVTAEDWDLFGMRGLRERCFYL